MATKKETALVRGNKLIKKAIDVAVARGAMGSPEPVPAALVRKLKLPNGESLSPGLRELLSFDGSWLGVDYDEDEHEGPSTCTTKSTTALVHMLVLDRSSSFSFSCPCAYRPSAPGLKGLAPWWAWPRYHGAVQGQPLLTSGRVKGRSSWTASKRWRAHSGPRTRWTAWRQPSGARE